MYLPCKHKSLAPRVAVGEEGSRLGPRGVVAVDQPADGKADRTRVLHGLAGHEAAVRPCLGKGTLADLPGVVLVGVRAGVHGRRPNHGPAVAEYLQGDDEVEHRVEGGGGVEVVRAVGGVEEAWGDLEALGSIAVLVIGLALDALQGVDTDLVLLELAVEPGIERGSRRLLWLEPEVVRLVEGVLLGSADVIVQRGIDVL
eukprot:7161699-Heterocapsa_arctica.AAC.1